MARHQQESLRALSEAERAALERLRAYPNNPAARQATRPQAKWRKAR